MQYDLKYGMIYMDNTLVRYITARLNTHIYLYNEDNERVITFVTMYCRRVYRRLVLLVLQVAIIRPVLMFCAAVLWADGVYHPGEVRIVIIMIHT